MKKRKEVSTIVGIIIVILATVVLFGGVFAYQYFVLEKINQVGAILPVIQIPGLEVYKNSEYGFELTLTKSWHGFSTVKQSWLGWEVDTGKQKYSGIKIVIKNPKTTLGQKWQDIPIMVFTHDIWNLVDADKISVSAAPIGPAKIGENAKYVFATPPRWYGFTDDMGWGEAVEIIKTFKAF